MQFSLLLYDDESFHAKPEPEQEKIVAEHIAFSEKLRASGAYVGGEPLDPSSSAKTLRAGGAVEDGPFADSKEQLGGYYIIDVESIDAAVEWARQCPTHKENGTIEVRPVPNYSGE